MPATANSPLYTPDGVEEGRATEEEFFISCNVRKGQYKTLIHVRLPKGPVQQSGIVIVEPWHPGDSWSLYKKVSEYEAKVGHVAVIVVGNPWFLDTVIKKKSPARYAGLSLPGIGARSVAQTPAGETTEVEVLAQVGKLIKGGGLPGVRARKVILGGMSQTGGVVRAFIEYEHAAAGAKSVYDGYFPQQSASGSFKKPLPDLDVPIIEIQGERELLAATARGFDPPSYRRADGPLYRLYEVPGMSHVGNRGSGGGGGSGPCTGRASNDYPTYFVYGATLANMINWVDKGIPAPHVSPIATAADGHTVQRDSSGNALGGYRVSYVDVPTKTFHAMWAPYVMTSAGPSDPTAASCDQRGWVEPLSQDQLRKLYSSHEDYVAKVNKSLDESVKQGFLLPGDADELREEARLAKIP